MTLSKKIGATNTINLHKIPIGKQSFIATVESIREELEINYYNNYITVPYIYLKDIKILVDTTWHDVECSGNCIRSKVGKKLEKLNLEEEDIISFSAQVEEEAQYFNYNEGETVEEDDNPDFIPSSPPVFLPRSYDGIIGVEIYETEFTPYGRLSKNNYIQGYDRKTYEKKKDTLDIKRKATDKQNGYFREVQSTYFVGRSIKNLSNIERY